MSETGTGQQVAQLYDSYMVAVVAAATMTMTITFSNCVLDSLQSMCSYVLTHYPTR
jgi:hypothetical protein